MRRLVAATAIALIMSTTPAYAYRGQSGQQGSGARDRAYDAAAQRDTAEAARSNASANRQNLETLNKMGPVGTSEDPHSDLISWATGVEKASVRRWMELFLAVLPPVLDVLCGVAMVEICLAVQQANRQDEEDEKRRREDAEKKGAKPIGNGRLEPTFGTQNGTKGALMPPVARAEAGGDKTPGSSTKPDRKVLDPLSPESVMLNDNKPAPLGQKGDEMISDRPRRKDFRHQAAAMDAATRVNDAIRDGGRALRGYAKEGVAKTERIAGRHIPQGRKIPDGIPSPQEIKDLRAALGLTQEKLAQRLVNEEGKTIATGTVSNWEQGAQAPSDFMLTQFNELRKEAAEKGAEPLAEAV